MNQIHRFFLPWKYIEETDTVNERSRQGFHLVKATRFGRTEAEEPSVCWYYRLDWREKDGFTELLYEKQGWEQVCRHGGWIWFRKKVEDGRPDSEYVIHGTEHSAAETHLHTVARRLDVLRNILLILAAVLILIPSELTMNWTPRITCVPLFLAILPVRAAGSIRRLLGEETKDAG